MSNTELCVKFEEYMSLLYKFCQLLSIFIVLLFCNIAQAKIIKWVDEKGVTHYGDQLPSQYAGHSSSEISQRGIVLKQNKPVDNNLDQINQEKQEQDKKDKALLASYTTVQEIDLARDRNLQLDLATMQNLMQQRQVIESNGAVAKKTSMNFIKQKKPLPANVMAELNSYKTDLARVDVQIAERKASMDKTKQRYAAEKARFMILKPSDTAPVNNAVAPANLPATPTPPANAKLN